MGESSPFKVERTKVSKYLMQGWSELDQYLRSDFKFVAVKKLHKRRQKLGRIEI